MRAYWIIDYNYRLPAYVSVSSFLQYHEVPVTVMYVGEKGFDEAEEVFSTLSTLVSVVRKEVPDTVPPGDSQATIGNRLLRMEIVATADEDIVLLLDADLLFGEGSKALIEMLQSAEVSPSPLVWGCAETPVAYHNYLYFNVRDANGRDVKLSDMEQAERYSAVFGTAWPNLLGGFGLNNGVLAFRNAQAIAERWRSFYLKGLDQPFVNPADDQLPLAAALKAESCTPRLLPQHLNSLGNITGDFGVYHAFSGIWEMQYKAENLLAKPPKFSGVTPDRANRSLSQSTFPFSSFSKIAQVHLQDAPQGWKSELLAKPDKPFHFHIFPGSFTYKHLFLDIVDGLEQGYCVEAGVNGGKSTCFMAELVALSGKAIRFDAVAWAGTEELAATFQQLGLDQFVHFTPIHSATYPAESLDFVFIHHKPDYDSLLHEMERWYPRLKKGGILAGMDYTAQDGLSFGQACATYDFCEKYGLSCRIDFDIFLIEKKI